MREIEVRPSTPLSKIQEYMVGKGNFVRFTDGNYKISEYLKLFPSTTIYLEKNAVLYRCCQKPIFMPNLDYRKSYKYNAVWNTTICGKGTLIGDGVRVTGSLISLLHSTNITIKDISLKNTYKSHAIDIGGCRKVSVDNVTFADRIIDEENPYKEEIQYDFCYALGAPYFPPKSKIYNGNHCEDLIISRCKFSGSNDTIGTHTETSGLKKHKNIRVLDCVAKGVGPVGGRGAFLKLINVSGAAISGNDVSGYARMIEIDTKARFYGDHGEVTFNLPAGKTGCQNILIDHNNFHDSKGNYAAAGVFASSDFKELFHDHIAIINNTFCLNNKSAAFDIHLTGVKSAITAPNNTNLKIKV
jgi:hypothetical protein